MRKSPLLAAALAAGLSMTIAGATPAQAATIKVEAEAYAAQSGATTEQTGDTGGGQNVAYLASGDWMRYDNVNLGSAGNLEIKARVASAIATGSGAVELRTGSQTGPVLASFQINATGGWQAWSTLTTTLGTHPTGTQTVFAVIRNSAGGDFVNINWFSFGDGQPETGGGWVLMDQNAWNQQLNQFNALRPQPVPVKTPPVTRVSEFNASCTYSHSKPDDPIVFPNMPGSSHMHSFFGNRGTNAATTTDSLLANANISCGPETDLSAYWIPTLYQGDTAIEPEIVVYYGSRLANPAPLKPFPHGLRMIVGDARLQTPTPDNGAPGRFYCAGAGGQIGRSTDGNWPICASTANIMFHLVFPDCWDGVHLDSPDHKSHVGAMINGACSGDLPVAMPNVSFLISYPIRGSAAGLRLASGMASSMHGDAWMAWDNQAMGQRVKSCLIQVAKCNTAGTF